MNDDRNGLKQNEFLKKSLSSYWFFKRGKGGKFFFTKVSQWVKKDQEK